VTKEESILPGAETTSADSTAVWIIGVVGVGTVAASFAVAPGWIGAAGAGLAILALAIAEIDRRSLIIPDPLNAAAFIAGIGAAGFNNWASAAVTQAFMRAAIMFGVFFVFRAGYRRLRGREGMGFGDVKLAAVAGVWLNWADLPIVVDIAALSALASVLIGRAAGKESDLTGKLPFGLFFAPAIWICWLLAVCRGN
jgi:leader peptidase (prepilin peptidase) / N-methyltransferase